MIPSICQETNLELQNRSQMTSKCIIDKSWFMQGSPGLKPDWFGEIRLLAVKYLNILL